MATTTTTQIPPATQAYYDKQLLARAIPYLLYALFGQQRPIKTRNGDQIKFRKYSALAVATTPLTEGVTPAGSQLSKTDITATLAQYGDFVTLSDVVQWVNQDPVLNEAAKILGEQAAETIDEILRDILVAGTNVVYSNGAARNAVNTPLSAGVLKTAIRALNRQNAKMVREQLNASTGIGTTPIRPAYIGIVGPDGQADLEGITGYKSVEEYAQQGNIMEGEIGAFKNIRFVMTTKQKVWADAGAAKGTMISTTGTLADVYATLIIAKDAYGVVPLAGHNLENIMKPLGSSGAADPLNQRGTSGWKAMFTAKILQELWMVRIEHAATDAL